MWKGKLTGTELVSQISNRQDRTLSSSRLLLQDHVDLYVKREIGPLSFGTWTRTATRLTTDSMFPTSPPFAIFSLEAAIFPSSHEWNPQ